MNAETAITLKEAASGQAQQVLTFVLAGEEYGVDILRVQEIRGWQPCTDLPNTPPHVVGVMNLRGTIVPIVDLRMRLGLPRIDYDATTVVVVLRLQGPRGDRTVGFVVDAVSEVHDVTSDQLRDPPDMGSAANVDAVRHLATVGEKMLILLEVDRLVEDDPNPNDRQAQGPRPRRSP